MTTAGMAGGYHYESSAASHTKSYLWPTVLRVLEEHGARRVFDLGCGNGAFAGELDRRGYAVIGVDSSIEGIRIGRAAHPHLELHEGSAYDDLAGQFGRFSAVVSLEVVEHLYDPRTFARTVFELLEVGGVAVVSTPYHGYWKNLALAVTGKMDAHFTALWDHGHIKFWSIPTLSRLLREAGFSDLRFHRVGRIPPLAKAMIAVARRADRLAPGAASRAARRGEGPKVRLSEGEA